MMNKENKRGKNRIPDNSESNNKEQELDWPMTEREFARRMKDVGTRFGLINDADPIGRSAIGNYSICFNQDILENSPTKIEDLESSPKVGNRVFVGIHFGKPNSFDLKDGGWKRWWATSVILSIEDNPIGDGSLILTTESGSKYFWSDEERNPGAKN